MHIWPEKVAAEDSGTRRPGKGELAALAVPRRPWNRLRRRLGRELYLTDTWVRAAVAR